MYNFGSIYLLTLKEINQKLWGRNSIGLRALAKLNSIKALYMVSQNYQN